MSTESNTTEETTAPETPTPMLGEMLRVKRESLGLSLREVADRLRLRVAIIESIEANDFQIGQVHTFTRGYVRSYAKLVGVDEKAVLDLFDSLNVTKSSDHDMQSFSQGTQKKKHDNNIMKLTWGIFAIIVGISAIWWYQNEQNVDTVVNEVAAQVDEQEFDPASIEPDLAEQAEILDQQEAVEASNAVVFELESVASGAEVSEQDAVIQPEVVEQESQVAETPVQLPAEIPPAILMSFKSDCWIKIQDVNGKTLSTGVMKAGQTLELEGQGPFKFVIGAPEAASLSISGEPFDLSGYTAGKVARFTAE